MQKNVGEFSTFDVVRIIGIDRSRLVHWMNGKFIPAGKDKPWGRGFKTVFSLFDLYSIALFKVCLDVSLSREVARRYWNYVDWERVTTTKEWQMVVTRKMDPLQKTKKRISNITEVKRKSKKSGKLPVQRYGIVDANFVVFAPFSTLKTLYGTPYVGEEYLGIFWEHNFRTVPFELLGLMSLARKGIGVIVGGAHGRTWASQEVLNQPVFPYKYIDHFHHEVSLSINSIFNLLRLDTAYRLDEPDFYIGVAFARFF